MRVGYIVLVVIGYIKLYGGSYFEVGVVRRTGNATAGAR